MDPEASMSCSQKPPPPALTWTILIQSTTSNTISLRPTLKLSSHLRLGLPSGFTNLILYAFFWLHVGPRVTSLIKLKILDKDLNNKHS
jgi:hypothetical protein